MSGQVHSYSLILPLFWILFFWSTVSRCLAGLFSLGYFVPLLRPVLGVCLGLCLSASHLLLSALVVPLSDVFFASVLLLVLCSGCWVLFSCCSVFPAWLLCLFVLLAFGGVVVWPALSWLCPLSPRLVGPLAPSSLVSD